MDAIKSGLISSGTTDSNRNRLRVHPNRKSQGIKRMKQLPKAEVLASIDTEHAALIGYLGLLADADMLEPGVIANPAPGQTAKDLLAHLTAWEQRMIACVQATLNDQPWPPYAKTHAFNADVLGANKDRPLEDIRLEFDGSFREVLGLIASLSEDQLAKNGVWQLIGYNTYNHYKWANKALKRWLKAKGKWPTRASQTR